MKRVLLLGVAVLLLWPGVAGAGALVTPEGKVAEPYQTWANRSKVPTVNKTITVLRGSCPEFPTAQGCSTDSTVWLNNPQYERETFFHELGHIAIRDWFQDRHYATVNRIFKRHTFDAERTADGYALCAIKRRLRWAISGTYSVTPRQHRKLCQVFRRSASEVGSSLVRRYQTPMRPTR